MTTELNERGTNKIAALRAYADWLEARPELANEIFLPLDGYLSCDDALDLAQKVRLVGSCEKYAASAYFGVRKAFPSGGTIQVYSPRSETCERVQVGEREVPVMGQVGVTTEPVYEWVCPPSILAGADVDA